ncbi:MAG: hypothetical protein V1707_02805 [bacterium]
MNIEKNIKLLLKYIDSLPDFKIIKPEIVTPYNHMGATITDAILQAGTRWETVVKPRILKLLKYPEAKTTKGFLNLLNKEGLKKLLDWKDKEKPARILGVVNFFIKESIKNETDLKKWLKNNQNITRLRKLRGIGNKTVDYLKILSGISTSAIDRHLITFLQKAGININIGQYLEAQKIINKTAERKKVEKSLFDYSLWKYMSDKESKAILNKRKHCA